MRHAARLDGWIVVAVLVGTLAPLLTHAYWASGVVLGVLLMGAYPQSYETTDRGLMIRAGLTRRLVPYAAMTFIGATSGARTAVTVRWGLASEAQIAPADLKSLLTDVAVRTPQLRWHGHALVSAI